MKSIRKILNIAVILILGTSLIGCDSFLDTVPDNRTQLDSPEKIRLLLISAYPAANHGLLCELSSDNMFDNRVPVIEGGSFLTNGAYERWDTNLFEWTDMKGESATDSPYQIWQVFYNSIATANAALEAIEELEKKGEPIENLRTQKGEALAVRAHCHFVLVNIFAMPFKDFQLSQQDLGITYMTKPETSVETEYKRDNVAYVYEQIIKDIEEAIPLINDSDYEQPAFHFNTKAAHAMAARVYLTVRNYQKVVEHADKVLGNNPASVLKAWADNYNSAEQFAYAFHDAKSPANLLLIPTYSVQNRRVGDRYGYNRESLSGSFSDSGPTWSGNSGHVRGNTYVRDQKYGIFLPVIYEFWEYSDKVAQVGYAHIMRAEYTTDATLLDRAEAKIFLDRIDEAVSDLNLWVVSHKNRGPLLPEDVENFYTPDKAYFSYEFHTEELSPSFIVSSKQKPYVDCALHLRRIDRIHSGERWFDIKRYGIELTKVVTHNSTVITLPWNDPRRAIQIPTAVIGAGLDGNPRPATVESAPDNSSITPYVAVETPEREEIK